MPTSLTVEPGFRSEVQTRGRFGRWHPRRFRESSADDVQKTARTPSKSFPELAWVLASEMLGHYRTIRAQCHANDTDPLPLPEEL